MIIRVLGSAAGGGFPQWNCGCRNCAGVRDGRVRALPRTQESITLSANGADWFIVNASPEIRTQIEAFAGLHPKAVRHTPIAGIFLTNGDLDHCLGLLSLRESQPITIYATQKMWRGFCEDNRVYRTLERFQGQVRWQRLRLGETLPLASQAGVPSGLNVCAMPVPGKLPIHLEDATPGAEDNVCLRFTEERSGQSFVYMPAIAGPHSELAEQVKGATCLFLDGTFWSDDELIEQGLGTKRAADMAHWPLGGEEGSLEWLKKLPPMRRVLIHINNTNPLLREDSPERKAVEAAGVQIAYDGMEFSP